MEETKKMEKADEIAEKVLIGLELCDEIEEFGYEDIEPKIVREAVKETAKQIFDAIEKIDLNIGYLDNGTTMLIKIDEYQKVKDTFSSPTLKGIQVGADVWKTK